MQGSKVASVILSSAVMCLGSCTVFSCDDRKPQYRVMQKSHDHETASEMEMRKLEREARKWVKSRAWERRHRKSKESEGKDAQKNDS